MIKSVILILVLFVNFLYPQANVEESITISKIKIITGEIEYSWEESDAIPKKDSKGITAPYTIISYLGFRPGQKISLKKLEQLTRSAELQLYNSVFFYDAKVIIVPPRQKPKSRTIVIMVKEGFLHRFGGGNAFGFFGMDNVFGLNKSYKVFLGYNILGGEWFDYAFLDTPIILGASLYYNNSGPGKSLYIDFERVQTTLSFGYHILPCYQIIAFFQYEVGTYINYYPNLIRLRSNSSWENRILIQLKNKINLYEFLNIRNLNLGFNIDGKFIPNGTTFEYSLLYRQLLNYTLFPKQSLNHQLSVGYSSMGLEHIHRFDFYATQDMSVRSGYAYTNLIIDQFIFNSLEYRINLFNFFVPPFFNIQIEGLGFVDVAIVPDHSKMNLFDAMGGGVRVKFDNPVFVYFTLAYGVNHLSQGRFSMTGTADF